MNFSEACFLFLAWIHCSTCSHCAVPDHSCEGPKDGCFICGELDHKRSNCPNISASKRANKLVYLFNVLEKKCPCVLPIVRSTKECRIQRSQKCHISGCSYDIAFAWGEVSSFTNLTWKQPAYEVENGELYMSGSCEITVWGLGVEAVLKGMEFKSALVAYSRKVWREYLELNVMHFHSRRIVGWAHFL